MITLCLASMYPGSAGDLGDHPLWAFGGAMAWNASRAVLQHVAGPEAAGGLGVEASEV